MKDTSAAADLLTLIGRAIEQLQRSVSLFETTTRGGADQLAVVIEDIDAYLASPDEDPLLHLAGLPPDGIRDGLLRVREDLAAIVSDLPSQATSDGHT